ncbi:hypothetical protein [Streptacidiphilus jiangxiensis]|uniref:Uncharacterized protein n=1 Tax=Streptacidiphilus jiangxiensis TaxID=235985 RepID=A0A1H8A2F4_STRJI|nr:hypothetical protein [Streptacidiphilus jiangxiensis]SEM63959.1 hypothetical protein SAMN05414137_13948 [Streptacidiphilus jiangxiensis]
MTDPAPTEHHHAHVVVHPVQTDSTGPFRRVDILGESVGKAYSLEDVAEFCRRAGLEELDLDAERMVEWRGGGHDVWE